MDITHVDEILHDPTIVNPTWSKIDRFHLSPELEANFQLFLKGRYSHFILNYFLLVFVCDDKVLSKHSFKFDNMWLRIEALQM